MAVTTRAALTTQDSLAIYVGRGLEYLWLLTAVLVPLIFVPTDFMLSEAVNAYVEVPKTTALRTLVGLMTILWILECALKGGLTKQYNLANYPTRLKNWLIEEPSRWVVVAATVYVVVAIITTILSQNFWISLWGEVSGQFGYSAYTTVSYFFLFAIIATHLKTQSQLWRLLGVIVATGVLVALYGIIQHYDLDPLNQGEAGLVRVASTMANSVFAGSALVITTLMTIGVGLMALDRLGWSPARIVLWVALIAAQMMAVYWTGARGSWVLGVPAGLLAMLVLAPLAFSPRTLSWATETLLVVGSGLLILLVGAVVLAVYVFTGAFLWQALLGAVAFMLLVGFAFKPGAFAKTLLIMGSGLVLSALIVFGTPSPSGSQGAGGDSDSGFGQVQERLTSVGSQVTGRGVSYRTDIWDASLGLVVNRPWFEYEDLSLSFLRPLVGYGPELFKYTFPLESPLGGLLSHAHNFWLHHFVEQGVLGFFSSLSLFIAFFFVGAIQLWSNRGTYSTTHKWILVALLATMVGRSVELMAGVARESDLVLFWVLLAIFVVLPSNMRSSEEAEIAPAPERAPPPVSRRERRGARPGRRERRAGRLNRGHGGQMSPRLGTGIVLVSAVVVFIGWLSWDKNIDYAWAATLAASSRATFYDTENDRRLQESHRLMSKAIAKAPDVPAYYHNLAGIYDAYRQFAVNNPDRQAQSCTEFFNLEPSGDASSQIDQNYADCARAAYLTNLKGFQKNRTSPQGKLALANFTLQLALMDYKREDEDAIQPDEETIQYFKELTQMLPSQYHLRNALATVYIRLGQPQKALEPLDESLLLTQGTTASSQALYLKGLAYRRTYDLENANGTADRPLDHLQSAIDQFEQSLTVFGDSPDGRQARRQLLAAYDATVVAHLQENEAEETFAVLDRYLSVSEGSGNSARAFYLQGVAYRQLDELGKAADSLELGLSVDENGPHAPEIHRLLAGVYPTTGDQAQANEHANLAVAVGHLQQDQGQQALFVLEGLLSTGQGSTNSARALYLQGVAYRQLDELEKAADSLEQGLEVEEDGPLATKSHLQLAEIYAALGQQDLADKHSIPDDAQN